MMDFYCVNKKKESIDYGIQWLVFNYDFVFFRIHHSQLYTQS